MYQVQLWSWWAEWAWISNWIQCIASVHIMWWDFFHFKWHPNFSPIPKHVSTHVRLHLPGITSKRNVYQHIPCQHGYKLHWWNDRFHWDEGRQINGLTADGTILWKWEQYSCSNSNNPKLSMVEVQNWGLKYTHQRLIVFSAIKGSHQMCLRVDWDSKLYINHLMCPNGHTDLEHVVAALQHQVASSPLHLTQMNIQTAKNVSTLSPSQVTLL